MAVKKEQIDKSERDGKFVLTLFIAGTNPKSMGAIASVKKICEEYLPGNYELEIIDIYQQPEKAREARVDAAPILLKKLPLPVRKLIGGLTKTEKIILGLELHEIKRK